MAASRGAGAAGSRRYTSTVATAATRVVITDLARSSALRLLRTGSVIPDLARSSALRLLRTGSVITALLACALGAARPARADPAAELGEAFRAYDAGDLERAGRLSARLPETALVNRDYLLWLRGMVALRTGDPAAARAAFERLGKLAGSRFAREVPWRLADAAWDAGDRAGAARQYARLVAAKDTDAAVADLGTARFRIAE